MGVCVCVLNEGEGKSQWMNEWVAGRTYMLTQSTYRRTSLMVWTKLVVALQGAVSQPRPRPSPSPPTVTAQYSSMPGSSPSTPWVGLIGCWISTEDKTRQDGWVASAEKASKGPSRVKCHLVSVKRTHLLLLELGQQRLGLGAEATEAHRLAAVFCGFVRWFVCRRNIVYVYVSVCVGRPTNTPPPPCHAGKEPNNPTKARPTPHAPGKDGDEDGDEGLREGKEGGARGGVEGLLVLAQVLDNLGRHGEERPRGQRRGGCWLVVNREGGGDGGWWGG